MKHSNTPPSGAPPASGGGRATFQHRRRRTGWGGGSLLISLAVHGAVIAGVAAWSLTGQGSGGESDLAANDSEAAAIAVFRAMPRAETQPIPVKVHAARNFLPGRSRVLAKSPSAEMKIEQWDMQPVKPLAAVVQTPAAPKAASDETRSQTKPSQTAKASKTSSTAQQSRRTSGAGAGDGVGNGVRPGSAARIVSSYPPAYPSAAKRDGAQGTAMVRVSLSDSGRVAACSIYQTTGNSALDEAALKAVRGWRFTSGMAGAEVLVRVSFRLS